MTISVTWAPRAHLGECLVARRVEECDLATMHLDLVGTDVLSDAAGLALGHARRSDGVEQFGLAMVDMAHDRDHWRAGTQVVGRLRGHHIFNIFDDASELLGDMLDRLDPEVCRDHACGFVVDLLVDVGDHAALEQRLEDL